jgi:leucyl-tRNA---protein transferase
MDYYQTDEKTLTNTLDDNEVTHSYNSGYLFTRKAKGHMIQTRSLRINLQKFDFSSENRRILKKNPDLKIELKTLPLVDYSWEIHKLGKEFYSQKFGDGTMSASKIKELFCDPDKSNMNSVFTYRFSGISAKSTNPLNEIIIGTDYSAWNEQVKQNSAEIGYCLSYANPQIIHYAYPFYDLNIPKELSLGMSMMLLAINYARLNSKTHIYLGSAVKKSAKYKLQFDGLEWWDNIQREWSEDLEKLESLLED